MLPNPASHARILVEHADIALAIARRREHTLDVRGVQSVPRPPEPVHQGWTEREYVGEADHPSCNLASKTDPSRQLIQRDAVLHLGHHADREMVLQVLAYSGQLVHHRDVDRL